MEFVAARPLERIESLDLWKRNANLAYRVQRAATWMERAERERDDPPGAPEEQLRGAAGRSNPDAGDPDAKFVCYWIAFNALYAVASPMHGVDPELVAIKKYLGAIAPFDEEKAIYGAVWSQFEEAPSGLLNNRYVFADFWKHVHGFGDAKWKQRFDKEWSDAQFAFKKRDGFRVLNVLFERLYTLRNQLVHGGATWKGSANGRQIRDGASLLGSLLPIFIGLMLDNPDKEWGEPYYPYIPA